jgi:phosphoglucosamine mutase
MSNQGLEEFLQRHHIALQRANVGDKYVLEMMREFGCALGGEQSGHIVFGEYAKTGDGLVSALQTMALVLRQGRPASEALNPFDLYPQQLLNMPIKEKKPFEKLEGYADLVEASKKDGVRSLVRYSGTENKLRILLESKEEQKIEKWMAQFEAFFNQALSR